MKQQQIVNAIRDGISHLKMLGPIQGAYAFGKLADKIQHELDTEPQLEICAYQTQTQGPVLLICCGDAQVSHAHYMGEVGYKILKAQCNSKPKWLYGQTPIEL